MLPLQMNRYYEAFLFYHQLAKRQQRKCNLGNHDYKGSLSGETDDLMENVELYDVVERKYAGFSQLINDCYYGWTNEHPYWNKMAFDNVTAQRRWTADKWTGVNKKWSLENWLYLMLFHRICGSGINYAKKPSGYNNTVVPYFYQCDTIEQMVDLMLGYQQPKFTSVGYQFPQFPKPIEDFTRGGDYYLARFMPLLIRELVPYLETGGKKNLREVGDWMLGWNKNAGLKQYHFQYAAFVADIADWFPEFVYRHSPFYYGSNAEQCIAYLAEKPKGMNKVQFLDAVMERAMADTGGMPYNLEDVCCDFIRWVENYVKPGADYDHLDRDNLWSSCPIKDHPFGRQKPMLDLGYVWSFNDLNHHPTGDWVIKKVGITPEEYRKKVREAMYSST